MAATSIHGALAHRLGAGHAWVVDVRDDSVAGVCPCVEAAAAAVRAADQLVDVALPDGPARLCATLAGTPVAASHVRRLADDALAEALVAHLDSLDENARVASANARTVAAYLVAHPLVHRVAYPGLVGGEGYEAAHAIMHDGFGPRVDWQDLDGAWHTVRLSAGDDARGVCASLPVCA